MTTYAMPHSPRFSHAAAGGALPLPSGWWLAPSIIGGGAIWVLAILSLIG